MKRTKIIRTEKDMDRNKSRLRMIAMHPLHPAALEQSNQPAGFSLL